MVDPNSKIETRNPLIVFAKPPAPGRVKTRLTTALSDEEAARLYAAFLGDAVDGYADLAADVRLYWSRAPDDSDASLPAGSALSEHVQQGDGLGARMRRAFRETLDAGAERAVIVGTDHPTLPAAFVERAFAALDEPERICIGPSDDGGYYLLGMNAFYPQLFADMTYSRGDVFEETLERTRRTSADLTVLPSWYDVDTPADLRRLAHDLDADPSIRAPRTRRTVKALRKQIAST